MGKHRNLRSVLRWQDRLSTRNLLTAAIIINLLGIVLSGIILPGVGHDLCTTSLQGITRKFFSSSNSLPHLPETDKIVIILKTGRETMDRITLQHKTFLSRFKNLVYISDADGWFMSNRVYDTFHGVYSRALNATRMGGEALEWALNESNFSKGWNRDSTKNLPGFSVARNLFPDKEWFLMIDDDTYVYAQNLVDLVRPLDPRMDHYWGFGMTWPDCTPYDKGHQKTHMFAQGGSGILISAKTADALTKNVDTCISRYGSCPFGDVQVGICINEWLGVRLMNVRTWVHDYGAAEVPLPVDPCYRPITSHRMRHGDILECYEAEIRSPGGVVTFEHIFYAMNRHLINGWDDIESKSAGLRYFSRTFDKHYKSPDPKNFDDCKNYCLDQPVIAWHYDSISLICTCTRGPPLFIPLLGSMSGIFLDRFQCSQDPYFGVASFNHKLDNVPGTPIHN